MIDLMELVAKAAKHGIWLGVYFEDGYTMRIEAKRGNLWSLNVASTVEFSLQGFQQDRLADHILEEIIYRLNEAEEKAIREGDPAFCVEKR